MSAVGADKNDYAFSFKKKANFIKNEKVNLISIIVY